MDVVSEEGGALLSTAKRNVLGRIGLLLAIAVVVMVFTLGSTASPGTAHAADETGSSITVDQDTGIMPVADTDCATCVTRFDSSTVVDIGLDDVMQVRPEGATIPDIGIGRQLQIDGATITNDDQADTIGIGSSVIVNDDTGSGYAASLVEVIDATTTDNIDGLGLTSAEGQDVLPVLYVMAFGLILLAIVTTTTMRQRRAFATGFLSTEEHTNLKSDNGRQSRAGPYG